MTQGPNGELNGTDMLVSVQQPAGTGPYIVVGSQRGVNVDEKTAKIDVSSKLSRNEISLPGRYSAQMSLDAIYIPSHSGFLAMQTAMRAGNYVRVQKVQLGVPLEYANCVITSLSEDFPDQSAALIKATFDVSDGWTVL
jgi:hypothetical protein